MNGKLNVTATLGTVFHDVAEGRVKLGDVLECLQRWETDMAEREIAAIKANQGNREGVLMATRARGMHLAVLSLGVRLELLLEGKHLEDKTC